MPELLPNLPTASNRLGWGADNPKLAQEQIELVVVSAGHQLFGLLMNQVFNIMQSGVAGFQILTTANAENNQPYYEIIYRNEMLRVLELGRILGLQLVEPLERSKILLTGQLKADGGVAYPFGVAIDEIITLRRINKNDLRLLPDWVGASGLGKLIWGVALVEREMLDNTASNLDYQGSALPKPFNLDKEDKDTSVLMMKKPEKPQSAKLSLPSMPTMSNMKLTDRLAAQRERQAEQMLNDTRRPLLMLDLQKLRSTVYLQKG